LLKSVISTPDITAMTRSGLFETRPRSDGPTKAWTGRLRLVAVILVATAGLIGLSPSVAFAGALTKTSWTVNNSQTGKTGVTYSYAFTTATSAALSTITMTVPTGTTGTVAAGTVYGIGAGTVSLSGTTLTYTVTSPATVAAGLPVYISFTGLTNTSTAGSYTSTVTTKAGATTEDSATTAAVTFGSSSTGVTVTVGQTLTFTNNTPSFSLVVDPTSLDNIQSQAVVLTVQTNAASGYTLAASDAGLSRATPAFTIPAVTSGPATGVATFPAAGWGASATLATGGSDGATLAAGLTGGKFVGYPSAATNFLTATGPTGSTADTLTLTDQAAVDYTVPDGTYSDTITYVATPNF
jgi:hypothetical protein